MDAGSKQPIGGTHLPPDRHKPIEPASLTPEELKMYKDCMNSLFYKAGLPFAMLFHVGSWLLKRKAEGQPAQIRPTGHVKNAILFFGNMCIGTVLFSPVCYQSLRQMRADLENRKKAEVQPFPTAEKTQPTSLPDDYNYPTDLTSTFNEAESTFTSEFSTSKILGNEDEPIRTTPRTTYQDLRRQHRSSFERNPNEPPPFQPLNVPAEKPEVEVPSREKEPRKFVKRNKYGDEIE